MNKIKIIVIITLLLIISTGTFWFYKKRQKSDIIPFKTQTPITTDIVQFVTASGTLKAKEQITIGSLEAGRVIKVIADDNDVVKKDQTLAVIDNGVGDLQIKKLEASLDEAKANLEYEEKYYKRQTQLFEADQISTDLFEQYTRNLKVLRAKVAQTEEELALSKRTYSYTFIESPADGIVISKEIDLGQMITARFQATVLYVIAKDLHKMEAQVDVDEADVGLVQDGQEVIFTVDAFPKIKFKAIVKQIKYLARIVDNVVTYATILNVDNPELKLRPGMTTNIEIKVAEAYNALVIPNKALRINTEALEIAAKKLDYNFEKIEQKNKQIEFDSIWIFKNKTFKQIEVKIGVKEGSLSQIISDQISNETEIIIEVEALKRENLLLKQIFTKPGGIGKSREK